MRMHILRRTGEGDQRGGGEWEPIKIPRTNLAYIPKMTRHPSLLTRLRPHSYRKAVGPQNQVRNHGNTAEDNNQCKPRHVRDDDSQNWIKRQLEFSQAFHRTPCGRVQGTTTWEQFRHRKLELFDLVAQEYDRDELLLQSTHNRVKI
jgi:hypothetical protein